MTHGLFRISLLLLALAFLFAGAPSADAQSLRAQTESAQAQALRAQNDTAAICAVENFARSEGRELARIPRAEMAALQNWCRRSAAMDVPAAAGRGATDLAVAGGGEGIWCPPFSTKCYCWNGPHWKGCDNFAAHCTDGLTCGPGGKACHCTSN